MKIMLSGGCFWCVEAIFQQLKNVTKVVSGYATLDLDSEHQLKNRAIWQKEGSQFYYSGAYHNKIEVVEITYDCPLVLEDILTIHYFTHNPTLTQWGKECMFPLNRSAVFFSAIDEHDKDDLDTTFEYLKMLTDEMIYVDIINNPENKPVSVEVFLPNQYTFSQAEDKQQNYYNNNPEDGYCTSIITPKLEKLKKRFEHLCK